MSEKRQTKRTATFSDTELVVISGPSVHTPGEQAKPRPASRPRPVIELEDAPAQIAVETFVVEHEGPANAH